jgi:hypothetical protein
MTYQPIDGASSPPVPLYVFAAAVFQNANVSSGTRAAARAARVAYQQASAVKDSSGTSLSTTDAGGFGLARPYLEWGAYPTAQETTPPVNTTSGSFVSLWTCSAEPQHPKLRVRLRIVADASTAGEVRLTDRLSGNAISSVLSVGSGVTVETDLDGTLLSPSLSGAGAPMRVDVQARRTSGAGVIAVLLMHALGKGT